MQFGCQSLNSAQLFAPKVIEEVVTFSSFVHTYSHSIRITYFINRYVNQVNGKKVLRLTCQKSFGSSDWAANVRKSTYTSSSLDPSSLDSSSPESEDVLAAFIL